MPKRHADKSRGLTFGPPVGFFAPKMAGEFSLGKLHIYPPKRRMFSQKNMVHLKIKNQKKRDEPNLGLQHYLNRFWGILQVLILL